MLKGTKKMNTPAVSPVPTTVKFSREIDGRWIAEMPSLPGVMAYGDTKKEALQRTYAIALRSLADKVEEGNMFMPVAYFFKHGMAHN